MLSIFIAIATFLTVFIVQLYLVRIFRILNIHAFISFVIHIFGLTVVVFLCFRLNEIPYTSILMYILLTILLVTFSFVPLLGVRSPTSVIITMLQKSKSTISQLQMAIDEKQMVQKRIEDLVNVGLVKKRGDRYIISPLGLILNRFISRLASFIL